MPRTPASSKILWTWDSPDIPIQDKNRRLFSFAHEYTPLAVGGKLYTSTSLAQVAAIDARTGETLWVFNPKAYEAGRPTNLGFVHRGIDYWTDGKEERLFLAAHDGYLYAIDAKTGKGISEFGEGGRVNLAAAIALADAPRELHDDFAADSSAATWWPWARRFPTGRK